MTVAKLGSGRSHARGERQLRSTVYGSFTRWPALMAAASSARGAVGQAHLHATHRLIEQRPHPGHWLPVLAACDTTQERFSLGSTVTAL